MARRSRVSSEDNEMELNMTPMLDVVFILLIFFIVTSVFVKTPGIDVFKPVAVTTEDWDPGILLAINAENEIWLDKSPYTLNDVRPAILAIRDENPKARAIIQADSEADVGTVMGLQQLMSDLNVETRVATEL